MKPRARKEGLVVKELPEELLVYDVERHRAHCLNPTAALVFRHCDGKTSPKQMARLLRRELKAPADDKWVWLALDRLGKANLLQERAAPPPELEGCSRRELLRGVGVGLAALLPVVASLVAPTPAEALVTGCIAPGACSNPADDGKACYCFVSSAECPTWVCLAGVCNGTC